MIMSLLIVMWQVVSFFPCTHSWQLTHTWQPLIGDLHVPHQLPILICCIERQTFVMSESVAQRLVVPHWLLNTPLHTVWLNGEWEDSMGKWTDLKIWTVAVNPVPVRGSVAPEQGKGRPSVDQRIIALVSMLQTTIITNVRFQHTVQNNIYLGFSKSLLYRNILCMYDVASSCDLMLAVTISAFRWSGRVSDWLQKRTKRTTRMVDSAPEWQYTAPTSPYNLYALARVLWHVCKTLCGGGGGGGAVVLN